MNLRDKKALVYDSGGLFTEQASRLAKDFGKVFYFCPWVDAFPKSNKALIGEGFDGLERILFFWDYVDKVDLIVFFDTHCSDMVEYLKSKGYPVAGAGKAEMLELNRWKSRQIQKEVGLPTQTTKKITGLDNLRNYLKVNKNKFVKIDIFRGDVESFKHTDYESSIPLLDSLAYEFGPKQDKIEFIVEEEIKGVEPGIDAIVFDGETLSPTMVGYEKKGAGYISSSVEYDKVSKSIKSICDRLSPIFKKLNTRFFFSTELKSPKKDEGYLIDNTVRLAAPCTSAIQTELIENFSEVLWGLGHGEKVQPIIKYKYAAGVSFDSEWANNHWLKVNFPKELRRWIKFRMVAKFDNEYYSVPGFSSVCSVIGLGNTIEEAVNLVKNRSKEVKAYQLNTDTSGLDEIIKDIEEGRKLGIDF